MKTSTICDKREDDDVDVDESMVAEFLADMKKICRLECEGFCLAAIQKGTVSTRPQRTILRVVA